MNLSAGTSTSAVRRQAPAAPPPEPDPGGRRKARLPRWVILTVAVVVLGAASAAAGAYLGSRHGGLTTAELMGLSRVPVRPAPGFTLTDQHGQTRSLASFRGRPVALYFMDPRCTDVCPLVAQEFEEADHALGAAARKVALIGVDVNPNATALHWVRSFDAAHGLNRLHNWYFFTGSLAALRRVWEAYSITVQIQPKTGDVIHTTLIEFIGRHGRERAMAVPGASLHSNGTGSLPEGELHQWGQGIAQQLRRLL